LERTAEYYCLARGAELCYTNLKNFKKDLVNKRPHFVIAVPRLLETVQKGVEVSDDRLIKLSDYSLVLLARQKTLKEQTPAKRKLINFFMAVTKLYIRSVRTFKNLLVRDARPNPLERVFSAAVAALLWPLYKLADRIAWSKIRLNLGGRVKVMVSGGSSIPALVENFYDMIGLTILNGYGLTETAPVICNRFAVCNVPT